MHHTFEKFNLLLNFWFKPQPPFSSLFIIIKWKDKHFLSFILDKVFAVNNERNQLKLKGIKIYSSKQLMTSCGSTYQNQNI